MTNLFHKSLKKCRGGATLVVTIILLLTTTMIIVFAANQGRTLTQMSSNQYQNKQAFEAAEAGLAYAINYLKQNATTILANPVNGYIPNLVNSLTANVILANGSRYTFTYANPIQNNYDLINVISTGTSSDGTASRVVSQRLQFGSLLATPATNPLTSKGSVSMIGSAAISNPTGTSTIVSGSTVVLGGAASTLNSNGVSSLAGLLQSDVTQNSSTLSSQSTADFFASYFGTTSNAIKSKVSNYYTNSSNTNYSSTLNGMTGASIWIEQTGGTASLSGNTTIGSATNPVLLIINGPFSISGNVTIYGLVYIAGNAGIDTLTGNTNIIGGLVVTNALSMTGNISITYNATVLDNLQNQTSTRYFAIVPGSWKDF